MQRKVLEIKMNMELELSSLREKRRALISKFKKKLEEVKIEQLKKDILGSSK